MNTYLCLYLIMGQEIFEEYISQVSALTPAGLEQLLHIAQSKKLKKGQSLLKRGEVCEAYYLVETGFLSAVYYTDQIVTHANFIFEGSFTCDLQSMKEQIPSLVSIEAGEDAMIWQFDSKILFESSMSAPEIMLFTRRLISRLQVESAEYENLIKLNKPAERYLYIENNNPELLQRMSTSQMASYLGITRDTLSRIRKKSDDNIKVRF